MCISGRAAQTRAVYERHYAPDWTHTARARGPTLQLHACMRAPILAGLLKRKNFQSFELQVQSAGILDLKLNTTQEALKILLLNYACSAASSIQQ